MLRGEVQLVLGFVQLRCELFQLLAQLALELEHSPHRFGFLLSSGGIESSTAAEHGFLDLTGDDGTNFTEIFPDCFDLECGTH
ncbi:MAG: hypothetical protein JW395_4112 [Nitrospira sp.]|nr:hypothetical protein [Nitrospira sp.]